MRGGILEIAINNINERIVITRAINKYPSEVDEETIKQEVNAILNSLFVKSIKGRYIAIRVIAEPQERIIKL